jgi:pimeloyl-ACP methyl ester carboxylesterase
MQVREPVTGQPGAAFQEGYVEADGFRIRYMEAGQGDPLVHIHGAGGLRLSRAHDLLSEQFHVVAFEVPGFGESPVNERSASIPDLARTMNQAVANLGLDRYNLMGTSFGGKVVLFMTLLAQEPVQALVLESPAAIRPEGHVRAARSADGNASLLYAHPERQTPRPLDPAIFAKQEALVARLRGPNRDPELEDRLGEIRVPVIVLFGTEDRMIPPAMGPIYAQRIPNCHFVLVYDAGHAIDADRPEAFAGVVADFVQRHERFVVGNETTVINP